MNPLTPPWPALAAYEVLDFNTLFDDITDGSAGQTEIDYNDSLLGDSAGQNAPGSNNDEDEINENDHGVHQSQSSSNNPDEGYGSQPTGHSATPDRTRSSPEATASIDNDDDDDDNDLNTRFIRIQATLRDFPGEVGEFLRANKHGNLLDDLSAMYPDVFPQRAQASDDVYQFLHHHQELGTLTALFKNHPLILGRALQSLEDDDRVLYKFLRKHRPIVGKFLSQHSNLDVLSEFLANYPAAMNEILDRERSIIQNFLSKHPIALYDYLMATPEVLNGFFTTHGNRLTRILHANPVLVSNYLQQCPEKVTRFLEDNPDFLRDYMRDNPEFGFDPQASDASSTIAREETTQIKQSRLTSLTTTDSNDRLQPTSSRPPPRAIPPSPIRPSYSPITISDTSNDDDAYNPDATEDEIDEASDDYASDSETDKTDHSVRPSTSRSTANKAGATTSTTLARHKIPYPAPAQYLAEDDAKVRNDGGRKKEWTLREGDCAIKHMLAVRNDPTFKGEDRMKEAVRRMNLELGGKERTWFAFKNFWNRVGRIRSGFDERRCKKGPLATSLQAAGGKRAGLGRKVVKKVMKKIAPVVKKENGDAGSSGGMKRKRSGQDEDEEDELAQARALAFGTRQKKKVRYDE